MWHLVHLPFLHSIQKYAVAVVLVPIHSTGILPSIKIYEPE